MPSQYTAENVAVSGGGRVGAHARRRVARPHQPRPLPARLHRVRGAARRLPAVLADPDPARGRARLRVLRRRTCAARCSGRGLSAILASNPCNPTGKLVARRRARRVGRGRRASSTARCSSTSSTRTTSGGRPGAHGADRERRALRRGRRSRSGRDLRRPDQELALPRLARDLDGRRRKTVIEARRERRLVPRRRRLAAAAARGDRAARRRRARDGRDRARSTTRSRKKRDALLDGLARLGVDGRPPPEGTFYVWGSVARPAAVAQRRHVVLPRRARAAR